MFIEWSKCKITVKIYEINFIDYELIITKNIELPEG